MNILFSNKLVKGLMTGLATMLLSLFTINYANAETTGAVALAIDSPIGATQEASTNHSAKSKTMLFCAEMASNDQDCKFYYNVLIGIDGVVHPSLHSSAEISSISITPSSTSGGFNVGGTIATENGVATAQSELFTHAETDADASDTMLPIAAIDAKTISLGTFAVADRNVKFLTGDLKVCFDSGSTPAGSYAGGEAGIYAANASQTETVKTITGDVSDTDRQALILLGGWNETTFSRSVLGYADLYTLAYVTTVVSNSTADGGQSSGQSATGCESEG